MFCLQDTQFKYKDTDRIKEKKKWKMIYHMTLTKINYSGYILSGKVYFRIRNITKNREGHYIMIMESIYKEGIRN